MGLKVNLKRGERFFIPGGSFRSEDKTVLFLEGDVPLLRERDFMTAETATTPAKRLLLALQKIYLSKQADELHELYILFARDVLQAVTGSAPFIARIDAFMSEDDHFKALKEACALVELEASLGSEQPVASKKPILHDFGTAA